MIEKQEKDVKNVHKIERERWRERDFMASRMFAETQKEDAHLSVTLLA